MNKATLARFLERPAEMQYERDLPLLKQLVESFPYYAGSYALLCRLLQSQDSIYLDKYLKLAAAYAGDREVLYHYLHPAAEQAGVYVEDEQPLQNSSPEPEFISQPAPALEVVSEPEAEPVFAPEPEAVTEFFSGHTVNIPAVSEEEQEIPVDAEMQHDERGEEPALLPDDISLDALEKEAQPEEIRMEVPGEEIVILEEAKPEEEIPLPEIADVEVAETVAEPEEVPVHVPVFPLAAYDYFAFIEKQAEVTEEAETEKALEPDNSVPEASVEEAPARDIEVAKEEEAAVTLASPSPNEKLSFTDWLDRLSRKAPEAPVTPAPEPSAKESKAEKQEPIKLPVPPLPETMPVAPKASREEMDDIISKFMEKEPTLKRPKGQVRFFTPEDVAQRSAEEDDNLITETLAKIYLRQELYDKAIDAYEKLSLKFPAKSRYFADKIEEIKNILK